MTPSDSGTVRWSSSTIEEPETSWAKTLPSYRPEEDDQQSETRSTWEEVTVVRARRPKERRKPRLSQTPKTDENTVFEALTAARAGVASRRELALRASEEREELIQLHAQLALKEVRGDLTKVELARLRYVRWNLDLLQEAEIGHELDRLEEFAQIGARIAQRMEAFRDELDAVADKSGSRSPKNQRRRRRRR